MIGLVESNCLASVSLAETFLSQHYGRLVLLLVVNESRTEQISK